MTPSEIEAEIERLHPAGFAWALACCGWNREDSLDVLQTSYLKILDGRARFAGQSSFKTFLFGVIRHTASEERRRNVVRRAWLTRSRNDATPPPPTAGPEDRAALLFALSRLSQRQREVLEAVFYMGLTIEEAAETLAISVGSARTHYERGKRRLFARLSSGGGR
jgi:RNA polymerase sigma-70 factor (ECF subfamily)